jgi:polar amino acid transport system permease protein
MPFGLDELLPPLLAGAGMTLFITLISAPLAVAIALIIGIARLSRNWFLRAITRVYVEIFRGTSLLVQLFYFFYVLPHFGISMEPVATGILVLALNLGSYGSETVRAAILSIPRGQHEACITLNMSPALAMRRVVLPQAFLIMLPTFGTMLIEILKATSILSLITITELSFAATSLFQTTGRTEAIYGSTLLIYFVMAWVLSMLMRQLERKLAVSRGADFRL